MVFSQRVVSRWLVGLFVAMAAAGAGRAQTAGTPVVLQPLPAVAVRVGGPVATVDLRNYFSISGVTGQIVQFDTQLGKYNVELFASDAPLNVANFLSYVNGGTYTGTIVHRSVPGFVIQGGGFQANQSLAAVSAPTTARLEYKKPNVRGTLAMARTSDPNSASSQWFVNLVDNTGVLGPGGSDSNGYTVFARVLGTGMTVVDAIAALPVYRGFTSPYNELPVRNYTSGVPGLANVVVVRSVTVVPVAPPTEGAAAVLGFEGTTTDESIADGAISGSVVTFTALKAGTATVTLKAVDSNGNFVESTIALTVTATPAVALPVIATQPASRTVAVGAAGNFTVTATSTAALSYQWLKDGVAIEGATASTYALASVKATDAGSYAVAVTNSGGTVMSGAATLTVTGPGTGGDARLSNLSVRTTMAAAQTLIVGFYVDGGSKDVVLRAGGPVLATFGLSTAMADPKLELVNSAGQVAVNDDWLPELAPAFAAVGAFAFPAGSKDAAIKRRLNGGYSLLVTGTGPGTVLVEGYDAESGRAVRLINVSARNRVGTGENVLIAGFYVNGTGTQRLLIRAVGPTLTGYGVTGALTDPKLELYNGDGKKIAENDNWDATLASTFSGVGAFALTAAKDSAMIVTVPAGASYSVQVKGADGGVGEALAEVYELP